jgi:hypothetical protein
MFDPKPRATNLQNQHTQQEIAEMLATAEEDLKHVRAINNGLYDVILQLQKEILAYRQNLPKSVVRRLDVQLETKEKYEDEKQIVLRFPPGPGDFSNDHILSTGSQ